MSTDDSKLQVRHDGGGKVLYVFNGKLLLGGAVPWQIADLIARESTRCARLAEEHCKANQIIYDNALIARSGRLPGIGLSDDPLIRSESVKAALYDRSLRRALPYHKPNGLGNIQSRGVVGAPRLSKRPATAQQGKSR